MIMSKPAPTASASASASASNATDTARSATNSTTNTGTTAINVSKSPEAAVQDLERRLAMLSGPTTLQPPSSTDFAFAAPPAAAAVTPTTATITATAPSNKNALLARIMAAQERAKQAQQPAAVAPPPVAAITSQPQPPPPAFDFLDSLPPPQLSSLPSPPAFDDTLLPPQHTQQRQLEPPPPAFDATILPPLASSSTIVAPTFVWNPHSLEPSSQAIDMNMMMMAPPPPSAPAFEDLLSPETASSQQQMTNIIMPPPMTAPTFLAPPSAADDDDPMAILQGLEDLTDEERQALLAEQAKIMASIEANKQSASVSAAQAAADRFESRSLSQAVAAVGSSSSNARRVNLGAGQSVALHGQERTRQAIADGTALLVQCTSCTNWMQVTQTAKLMFCPVCQTVSPVDPNGPGVTDEQARQLEADQALAEQLQKEEYKRAGAEEARGGSPSSRSAAATRSGATAATSSSSTRSPAATTTSSSGQSWMEWLGFGTPAPAATAAPNSLAFAQRPTVNPTTTPSSPQRDIAATRSYDSQEDQDATRLLRTGNTGGGGGGSSSSSVGGARVAQRGTLFSCVADSVSVAASSLMNPNTLTHDSDGNVHGVDASSLLVMPQVGRGNGASSETNYSQLDDRER